MKANNFEESRITAFEEKHLYLEEAIMERYKKRTIDQLDLLEYKSNLEKVLKIAPKIELNTLVDYTSTNTRLLSTHLCDSYDKIAAVCLRGFNELIKSLSLEKEEDCTYIIVSHGMFLRLREVYFTQKVEFCKKAGYNSFSMFRIHEVKEGIF